MARKIGEFYVLFMGADGRWHRPRVGTFDSVEDASRYIESRTDYGRVKRISQRASQDEIVWNGRLVSADTERKLRELA